MIHDLAIIHPKADVDPSAQIGSLTKVWANVGILAHVRIGSGCSIGRGTEVGRGTVIKDRARIGWNVFLPPNSFVGERVFIGPGTICCDDKHPRVPEPSDPPYEALPPIIEDDAVIGAGVVLLPGVRIGKRAFVGAGAVVTKNVADGETVAGLPARPFPVTLSNTSAEAAHA